MRNALISKLNAVIANIETDRRRESLEQLEHDILTKTDGCPTIGSPDKNDWITDCASQTGIYSLVEEILALSRQ